MQSTFTLQANLIKLLYYTLFLVDIAKELREISPSEPNKKGVNEQKPKVQSYLVHTSQNVVRGNRKGKDPFVRLMMQMQIKQK